MTAEEKARIEKNRLEALNKLKQTKLSFETVKVNLVEEEEEQGKQEEDEEEVPLVNKKLNKTFSLSSFESWANESSKRKYKSKFEINEEVNSKLSLWR